MNKCYLQLWEESKLKSSKLISSGCTLHYDLNAHSEYLDQLYSTRGKNITTEGVPDVYDREVGRVIDCFISDELWEILCRDKNLRLSEIEKRNLFNFGDLIIREQFLE